MADILMFHRVLPKESIGTPNAYGDRGTLITTDKLHQVLRALRDEGKRVVPLLDLVGRLEQGRSTRGLVALTFDDGYSDNFDHARSILKEHDCQATFFPVVGPVLSGKLLPLDRYYQALDRSELSITERNDRLVGAIKEDFLTTELHQQEEILAALEGELSRKDVSEVSYMSIAQLHTLHAEGHTIGVHTSWHRLLICMTEKELRAELEQGLHWVRQEFREHHAALAYPDGRSSPRIRFLARELGYRCGLGVGAHREHLDLFDLPRHFVTMSWGPSQLGPA
jgi:peptidoglycan/xylan/chitin deacetylase (PgdA/CDA1 family)